MVTTSLDPAPLIKHVEFLVSQDETELALKCLDMVPAFYRDHRHPDIEKLRTDILAKMLMPIELQHDDRELPKSFEHSVNYLNSTARGIVLKNELQKANDENITPHIKDFGPGDFTFALSLYHLGYSFTYEPVTFHSRAIEQFNDMTDGLCCIARPGAPVWLVAYEIIEHLVDTTELKQICSRTLTPKKLFFSTPKYTFHKGTPNWRVEGIHHRRAYTPNEFYFQIKEMFREYKFTYVDDPVMVLVGDLV